MEWLASVPIQGMGVVTLVVFIGALIWTGRLLPRTTIDSLLADKDTQITQWQAAYATSHALSQELASQNAKLLINSDLTAKLLESIRNVETKG